MNAYDLAKNLELAQYMLRQQADRITELEFNIRMNEMKYLEKIEKLEENLASLKHRYKVWLC